MDTKILLLVAVAFGVARFVVPVTGQLNQADLFKDVAHVVVGFMFGYAAYAKTRKELWLIAAGLTVLELVAFFVRKN
jgi:peptidoglycan/LPS O-acetylase OafA/YrhL